MRVTALAGDLGAGGFDDADRRLAGLARQALAAVAPDELRRSESTAGSPSVSERGFVSGNVALLTDAQRDCLRLVYRHMTSKDIARTLGVSPHTVDMRLRTAMRTLAVDSRIDAARLLVDHEGSATVYQPLIYQSSELGRDAEPAIVGSPGSTSNQDSAVQQSPAGFSPDFGPSAAGPPRLADAPSPGGVARFAQGTPAEWGADAPLSPSVPWGGRNTLGSGPRLAWIAVIAIGSALSFGAILGALEALKHLL